MERKSENFSCYTQNQLFRMYPLSFCMHLYTHKHTKLFLFLVLNVTILCILLCCLFFTYYFLDPFLCQYIQIYRHTHFFYLVQIYHHPLNHSFTDRNLSFFQFSHQKKCCLEKLSIQILCTEQVFYKVPTLNPCQE